MGAVSFKDVTLRYAGTGRRRRRRATRGGAAPEGAAAERAGVQGAFAAERPALAGLDLEIADGEFLVLVGPSGSGKSTALRILAGLEQPTSGAVLIDGEDITGVDPAERDVAMVFQTYALYPHKTVEQNMSFALQLAKVPREEISRRAAGTHRAA
jgi:multiple sugar transport system ATP-binding protein